MTAAPHAADDALPVLAVKDFSIDLPVDGRPTRIVDSVSLQINPGETLGLVGESGSGKSLTGLAIMGLLPRGGRIGERSSIQLAGRELSVLPDKEMQRVRGSDVAMIFQDSSSSLNPTKTIGAQVAEPLLWHESLTRRAARRRATDALAMVGIPKPAERLDSYPHELSGGMRQRVMIACALICEPKLLIADEPTTALDVTIQEQLLQVLDDLKSRLGLSMLLITHDMGVLARRADRVAVMYAGRIVESTDSRRLFEGMRHPYTQALLASIPRLDQDSDRPLVTIAGSPPELGGLPDGCVFAGRCPNCKEDCLDERPELSGGPDQLFACYHPIRGPLILAPRTEAPAQTSAQDALPRPPALEAVNLVKHFPLRSSSIRSRGAGTVQALSGVSITVAAGEVLGIVGESGCGKTTLGRTLVGLETPTSGQVLFDGVEVHAGRRQMRERRRDLQMMFQDPMGSFDPRIRMGASLREPLVVQRVGTRKEQDARVAHLLDQVGLHRGAMDRFPHEFSGGQRQRLGLARALMPNPRVLVADEPVSALDVSIRSQVLNLFKRLQADLGLSTVLISHDLTVVKYLADRVGVMFLGKLVEVGPVDEVYTRPAHPYTDGLIKAIPIPEPTLKTVESGVGVRGEPPSPIDPPSGCRFRTRCPRAEKICATTEPPLASFGSSRFAACHFPLVTASDAAKES